VVDGVASSERPASSLVADFLSKAAGDQRSKRLAAYMRISAALCLYVLVLMTACEYYILYSKRKKTLCKNAYLW
jgi:hypothetical protein